MILYNVKYLNVAVNDCILLDCLWLEVMFCHCVLLYVMVYRCMMLFVVLSIFK